MLSWHYVTSAEYKAAAAATKTADKLYFLSDTHEIYRGTELFTQAYELYTTLPTAPAVGRIYIDSATLEGKVYNGSGWSTVIQPVQAAVDKTDTAKPVSGKAVGDYVATEIGKVTTNTDNALNGASYAAASNTLTFTRVSGKDPVSVEITDLPCDLKYDETTGLLQIADKNGAAIGTGINLDLERFVKSGEYDPATKKITLYFDDAKTEKVEIDAAALVDIYTGEATTTATVAVSADNKITATVKLAEAADNKLSVHQDGGLYVAPTDLSAKMDKDSDAVENNLAKFDAAGNAVDGGVKAGAATLASTPNATTLATEAAVEAIRSALQTAIDGKIAKVANATVGDIATLTADGQVSDSGKKVGGATLAETADANTLATEAAVKAATEALKVGDKQDKDKDAVANNLAKFDATGNTVDAGVKMGAATLAATPNATTVASEAAVADALTWKTTV